MLFWDGCDQEPSNHLLIALHNLHMPFSFYRPGEHDVNPKCSTSVACWSCFTCPNSVNTCTHCSGLAVTWGWENLGSHWSKSAGHVWWSPSVVAHPCGSPLHTRCPNRPAEHAASSLHAHGWHAHSGGANQAWFPRHRQRKWAQQPCHKLH